MISLRSTIQRQVHGMTGFGSGTIDLDTPKGDPGLFGPGSVTWRVHGDFTSMMIGGIASLIVQMLHSRRARRRLGSLELSSRHGRPLAADRAVRVRHDLCVRRTGGAADRARAPHSRRGEGTSRRRHALPTPTTPDLLRWVHVAEVSCFLDAHLRYRNPGLSPADQDRYFAEMAGIAERFGATNVPASRRAVDAYFRAMQPSLEAGERARRSRRHSPVAARADGPSHPVSRGDDARRHRSPAAWAARMHGLGLSAPRRGLARAGAAGIGTVIRWSLRDGSAQRAMRRVQV